jgi:hypothetical protein
VSIGGDTEETIKSNERLRRIPDILADPIHPQNPPDLEINTVEGMQGMAAMAVFDARCPSCLEDSRIIILYL